MFRSLRIATVLAALLILSLGWASSVAAQEAGDQIVDPEGTPAANAASDDGNVTAAQEDDSTDDQAGDDADQQEADATETPDTASDTSNDSSNSSDNQSDNADDENQDQSESDSDSGSTGSAAGDELIAVEDLNLREEASVDSDVIAVIPAGSTVTVAGDGTADNDFVPISYKGDDGWGYVPYLVTPEQGDNLAVVTTDLNLRTGPSIDDEILTVMPTGAEVRVAGIATDSDGDDWNHVLYEDGTFAWALANYIEFTNAPAASEENSDTAEATTTTDTGETTAATATVSGQLATTIDLNLRAGPTLDDEVLLVLPAGTVVSVDGEAENGFVPVTAEGMSGWASTDFLAPAEEVVAPVTDAAATTDTGAVDTGETAATDVQSRTTLSDISLRAGPSTDDELLLVIPAGDVVTLTPDGAENGYVTVDYQGVAGWALAEYLQE